MAQTTSWIGDLAGLCAIVTGASSGNGRAIALRLAQAGAKVLVSDIVDKPLQGGFETSDAPTHLLIKEQGGEAAFFQADVARASDVEALVAECIALWGRLDVIIANAGIFCGVNKIEDEPETAWDKTMAVNAKGAWLCSKYACRQMVRQSPDASGVRGKIINIASVGGMVGLPLESSYCMSKGAVIQLTRQVALDYAEQGITCNSISPGFILTAMTKPIADDSTVLWNIPIRKAGKASDIASACLYLASPCSAYVTGTNLPVDGGRTC